MADTDDLEQDDDPVHLEVAPRKRQPRPDAHGQAERNMQIVAARARHVSVPDIAAEWGLTERRVRQILLKWRETNPTLRAQDPVEIVDELLIGYEATIEDLAVIARRAVDGNNLSAAVGAHNSKMRAYREMAELLQATGVLPHDLGTFNLVIDGRITAERIITVLERFNVSEEVFDAMLEALGGVPELGPPG